MAKVKYCLMAGLLVSLGTSALGDSKSAADTYSIQASAAAAEANATFAEVLGSGDSDKISLVQSAATSAEGAAAQSAFHATDGNVNLAKAHAALAVAYNDLAAAYASGDANAIRVAEQAVRDAKKIAGIGGGSGNGDGSNGGIAGGNGNGSFGGVGGGRSAETLGGGAANPFEGDADVDDDGDIDATTV